MHTCLSLCEHSGTGHSWHRKYQITSSIILSKFCYCKGGEAILLVRAKKFQVRHGTHGELALSRVTGMSTWTAQGGVPEQVITYTRWDLTEAFQRLSPQWPNSCYFTHSLHCWQTTTHGNGLVCASKCFRWPSGKAVWLWYSLTMTQHCVSERHNDGCLQVALTTRLHCTTHHRYMDEGLCLLTCKELRFIFKSMSVKNVSSFGQYFRRLATLI